MIIMTLPLYANAQKFNLPTPQMQNPFIWGNQRPKVPEITPTLKPLYRSHVENAKAKLAREEQKLIKLARKAWKKEADLKKEKENLKNLENNPENSNNPYYQKKFEKLKTQIAKSQDKLNKVKTKVDLKSKELEDFELAIEEARFQR